MCIYHPLSMCLAYQYYWKDTKMKLSALLSVAGNMTPDLLFLNIQGYSMKKYELRLALVTQIPKRCFCHYLI